MDRFGELELNMAAECKILQILHFSQTGKEICLRGMNKKGPSGVHQKKPVIAERVQRTILIMFVYKTNSLLKLPLFTLYISATGILLWWL
jgi:hypothetical protein